MSVTGAGGSSNVDAGGGTAVTTLTGSKALDALTSAQAAQLCNDTSAYFNGNITKTQSCKFQALTYSVSSSAPTDTDLQAGCTATETACDQSDASTAAGITCNPIPTSCAATVAQYSSCVVDQNALFKTKLGTLPACSAVTRATFDAIYTALPNANPPASCATLMTACPDLMLPFPGV
jgi:hypothetical protein